LEGESFFVHFGFGFLDSDVFGVAFDLSSEFVQADFFLFDPFLFLFFAVFGGLLFFEFGLAFAFFSVQAVFSGFFYLLGLFFQPF